MNLCLNILGILCILFVAILLAVCITSFIENRRLYIARYDIKDPIVPKSFDGFRIVQVSDLHNNTFEQIMKGCYQRLPTAVRI